MAAASGGQIPCIVVIYVGRACMIGVFLSSDLIQGGMRILKEPQLSFDARSLRLSRVRIKDGVPQFIVQDVCQWTRSHTLVEIVCRHLGTQASVSVSCSLVMSRRLLPMGRYCESHIQNVLLEEFRDFQKKMKYIHDEIACQRAFLLAESFDELDTDIANIHELLDGFLEKIEALKTMPGPAPFTSATAKELRPSLEHEQEQPKKRQRKPDPNPDVEAWLSLLDA